VGGDRVKRVWGGGGGGGRRNDHRGGGGGGGGGGGRVRPGAGDYCTIW